MKIKEFVVFFLPAFFLIYNPLATYGQYFQQEVNYKIAVRLNDISHELSAFESFEYINHSPDTLYEIYIHLWPNAYKNKNTALSKQELAHGKAGIYFTSEKDRGYIDSLSFKAADRAVKFFYDSVNIDIGKIRLNEPLFPGNKTTISTPFRIKIPSGKLSRCGHLDQAYMISQWYPKPAVYDELGWHTMPYLNQGEFYSEFGSFEVSITMPRNYVVGATGDLQNEDELIWLETKVAETKAITKFDKDMKFPVSDTAYKTLVFKQTRIHDFAWFADKRYHVLKGIVELPHAKERVTTWAMFTNSEPELWKKSIQYINNTLYYYSLWNGDYAYKHCTAVDGTITAGSGMEYPNIAVIGKAGSDFVLEDVIVHEVGHNWFYGMLGSNERMHSWMDEGINASNEIRYLMKFYNNDSAIVKNVAGRAGLIGKVIGISDLNMQNYNYLEYLFTARNHNDQPIETPAPDFTALNYGLINYAKTALGFNYLRSYLGDEKYDSCMQEYFNQWKFRHPYPKDLKKIFTEKTGKNLNWFFDDFLQTTKRADYKICSLQRIYGDSFINPGAKGFAVKITNLGNTSPPFPVSGLKNGEILYTRWHEGFSGSDTLSISCDHCDQIKIDALEVIPEINRKNNTFRSKGIFKGVEKISFPFFLRLENPDRTQISWLPIAGWNNYNKTMVGLAVHNLSVINKKFEYLFAPMYSFGTNDMAGSGGFSYTFYPGGKVLHHINLQSLTSRYSYFRDPDNTSSKSKQLFYNKVNGNLNIVFKKKNPNSTWSKNLLIRNVNIWEDKVDYKMVDSSFKPFKESQYRYHNIISFVLNNKRVPDPFHMTVEIEQGKNYVKPSFEFVYRLNYTNASRGIDFRFFTQGFFLNINKVQSVHLSGTGKGSLGNNEDYLYDNTYLGRSEYDGLLSQQFYHQAGDFKFYTPIGRNDLWIATLNIKAHLPGQLPVRAYLDLGFFDGSRRIYEDYKGITYDAGLSLCLLQDVFEIYFPIFHSKDIKRNLEFNEAKFTDQIRFVFNISAFSPFKLREALSN